MFRTLRVAVLAFVMLTAPWPAEAVTVSGQINGTIPAPRRSPDLYGKYRRGVPAAELPHPLLVVLKPAGGSAAPKVVQHPVIDQRDERFQPNAIVVQTGTTVEFMNSDAFYHNVFSLSSPAKFDLGRYRKGTSRPVTFDKPGLVKLFCDIHPGMLGYVLVSDSPWGAAATSEGHFTIDDVPAGKYDVIVWHEPLSEPETISTIDVTPDHPPFELDLPAR